MICGHIMDAGVVGSTVKEHHHHNQHAYVRCVEEEIDKLETKLWRWYWMDGEDFCGSAFLYFWWFVLLVYCHFIVHYIYKQISTYFLWPLLHSPSSRSHRRCRSHHTHNILHWWWWCVMELLLVIWREAILLQRWRRRRPAGSQRGWHLMTIHRPHHDYDGVDEQEWTNNDEALKQDLW